MQNGQNNTPKNYNYTSAADGRPNRTDGVPGGGSNNGSGQGTSGIRRTNQPRRNPSVQTGSAQPRGQHSTRSESTIRGESSIRGGINTAAASGRTGNSTGHQSINRQPARQNHTAAVTVPHKKESTLSFLKRTFAVDKTVLEQRAIVREQGSYDYVFLIIVLVLLAFGTVMVYSASYAYSKNRYDDSYYIIFRQAIFIIVGFIGMGFAMWFRPEWYKKFAVPIYIICFFMLSLVPIPGIGVAHKGAQRWISLGFTEIQPSEFMKLGLVFMLAWYMDRYYERVTDYKHFGRSTFFGIFVPFVIVGTTCGLVIIEKHLSGTIIMFLIGIIVIYAGGGSMKVLSMLGGIGAAGLLAFALLTDYTKRRFDIWLNPEAHPTDGGWQTLQGLYAIGSGGFFGVGLGESRQKHLYVSEPQNDFIFTIVCEELGFVGAIAVILLFILFIYRGFVIAMKAPDTFSSLMVIGIVGKVATQALLNIAVVTNSIPNTGISLPFFSYGGSSLVILMIEMGVVLSISRFSKQRK